jgi:8-amino-7-oxononanoate synthase
MGTFQTPGRKKEDGFQVNEGIVHDFTSSLYLGFRHPSRMLESWESLTTGAPATLDEPLRASIAAHALARLQGCERGVLAPSTLHLFLDLFGILSRKPAIICMDAGVYPIARWGVERAAGRGIPVWEFPHRDARALRRLLRQYKRRGVTPLIVTDGFCPACGRPAPVREYLACAREFEGLLIIDDTQSLGILGHSPGPAIPYGKGGGGVVQWSGVSGPEIILASSLAKGFGAPIAVLSGSGNMLGQFMEASETRVHCSQPSTAVIHAALHALQVNSQAGDALRLRLARLVSRFRNRLVFSGLTTTGGIFPFQTLLPIPGIDAVSMHEDLLRRGAKAVLHKGGRGKTPLISFIITARHTPANIDQAVEAIHEIMEKKYAHAKLWG